MNTEEILKLLDHIRATYPVDHDQSEDYRDGFDDGVEYVLDNIREKVKA